MRDLACAGLLAGATAVQATGSCALHLAVSNQSMQQPLASLEVRLDGRAVLQLGLPVATQHHYCFVELELPCGTHELQALETRIGLAERWPIELGGELWLRLHLVDAAGGPPRFDLSTSTRAMGIK